ncbi:MAG: hypothetical protein [Circular genetic element sp.]|nr:MAG: hypothetical protein [Circular genetic element sp.]
MQKMRARAGLSGRRLARRTQTRSMGRTLGMSKVRGRGSRMTHQIAKVFECRNCYNVRITSTGHPTCGMCRITGHRRKMIITGWVC